MQSSASWLYSPTPKIVLKHTNVAKSSYSMMSYCDMTFVLKLVSCDMYIILYSYICDSSMKDYKVFGRSHNKFFYTSCNCSKVTL